MPKAATPTGGGKKIRTWVFENVVGAEECDWLSIGEFTNVTIQIEGNYNSGEVSILGSAYNGGDGFLMSNNKGQDAKASSGTVGMFLAETCLFIKPDFVATGGSVDIYVTARI